MRQGRPRSLNSGEGVDSDLGGTDGEQGLRALVDGGAGGEDIVNDEQPAILYLFGPHDPKGAFDVFFPLFSSSSLRVGGPDPSEQPPTNRKSAPSAYFLRQERRLIEASLLLALGMKRDRNQQVELAGIEQSVRRLDHQTAEMPAER